MRELPGIRFETVPPPPAEALPRMDVAAFVGFAQAGPLDVPVAVEDSARFRDLFGDDIALAWDAGRERLQHGLLGAAVESFFANGGRRCFVVRVAAGPHLHRFDLAPGLASVGGTLPQAAQVRARSPGAWAEALRAGTTLQPAPLALLAPPVLHAGAAMRAEADLVAPPGSVAPGDLLELAFEPGGLLLFGAARGVQLIERGLRVTLAPSGSDAAWQWARAAAASPPDGAEPPRSARLELLDDAAGFAAHAAWSALPEGGRAARARRLTFEITVWREERLIGRIGELSFCAQHPRFFGNLPSDEALFAEAPAPRADGRDAEFLALRAEASGERRPASLGAGRRFPLAGPADAQPGLRWPLYLPNGMDLTRRYAGTAEPLPGGSTDRLAQDGLAAFRAELFFDPRLRDASGDNLLRAAEHLHNLLREWRAVAGDPRRQPLGPRPEPLRGLHALLPVDEATLLAAPDAVQRAWSTQPLPASAMLAAPWLDGIPSADAAGRLRVSWSEVAGATDYRLEWDESAEFTAARLAFEGPDRTAMVVLPASCADAFSFRVRAQRFGEPSSWSNTRVHRLRQAFVPCTQASLPELRLSALAGSPGPEAALISWSPVPPATGFAPGTRFRVETAGDALFQSARVAAESTALQLALPELRTGLAYYRVRALLGDAAGPWSNALAFGPTGSGRPLLTPPDAALDGARTLAVHRALLRLCAARGDLLGLLALPRHFGAPEVLDYIARLTGAEADALSYGALYHPWTARAPGADGAQREVEFRPPEGAAAGRLAATALAGGAWISSSNQPLAGVLALDPPLSDAQAAQLDGQQVNLVRRGPRDFALANDQTLSRSNDTRPVTVRRLLILLKRLALREGAAYVFEPLTSDFPDRVRHRFQRLLSHMHVRGAFEGEDADEAFRVVVDTVNPPRSLDLGRFIVELRVAPSRPLSFLRVRLVQRGPRELAVGEA